VADELSFRAPQGRSSASDPGPLIAVLLVVIALIVFTRPLWEGRGPEGTLVEVAGDVPRPGLHLVAEPTVEAALAAAGVAGPPADPRPVPGGHLVRYDGAHATIEPPSDPLLVGLPIDVNAASAHALEAIPGVGSATAARILADRQARGTFRSVDDLGRVPGVSLAMVERLRPFVVVGGTSTIDANTATAARLELLDGIGPVLAGRIVEHREAHGPFADLEALARVPGIHSGLLERLDGQLVVGP